MNINMDTAVLCTIAKDEFPYIDEWIQYHLKIGFDHIYIYDNENMDVSPMMTRMDIYKNKVTVIPFKGQCQQMNAYYHFLQNYRTQHTWVGYIDVDEFIVLRKFPYITIHDLLRTHCTSGALALNWVLFGSNDKETYEPFPVVSRFIRRQKGVNEHVKWIVRISDIQYMVSPHHGVLWFGHAHDCHGTIVNGPYNPQGTDDIACIHHYFTKSKEEFLLKCKRGRADIPEFREFERDFYRHDCNEIEDTTAWEIFNGKK
jgi:hypothetical protein